MKRMFILGSMFLFLFSCSTDKQSNENIVAETVDSTSSSNKISDEALMEVIKSIPSPIEISMLIKKSGEGYDNKILNPTENSSAYNSNFKRALNLGIYGADLGYINIYDKNKDALSYLSSIKKLADDLNIGQFYDFQTIQRLVQNSKNNDSLLYITTNNFEKINSFLQQKKRADQSVLILTGGWLEALHISCELAKKDKNPKLLEKIGEQKIVLDQILLLVSSFKNHGNMDELANDLQSLKKVYDQIKITYEYKESKMKDVNGVLTIEDQSESKVNITDSQVIEIAQIIDSIRHKVTQA
jgi:hypothetical protein